MNKLSSALGAFAVIAISVVFILQFRPASNVARTDSGPECAVEVKGACLSKATFMAAARLIGSGGRQSRGYGRRIADGLLEAWLLNQDAKRLGLAVSEDDISAEIVAGRAHVSLPVADLNSQIPYDLQLGRDLVRHLPVKSPKTKKFDVKYAEKQIRYYTMMSPTDFREYQKSEITAARMRELIQSRVRISENEAFSQFSQEKSTATLSYVRFDRRFFGDLLVDMSQRAIDAWAGAHKEEIDKAWSARKAQLLPECRVIREIFVKLDEGATDDEKAAARKKIDHARERIILKNEDFSDVARAMSDDPSAVRGGQLGCMLKGRRTKQYEDAVAALKPGKVSDVISTDGGFYLVKLEQVAKDADAEKVGRAWAARELYLSHEADRMATEAAQKVAAAVKGGKSLKDALDLFYADLPKPKDEGKKDEKKADKKADKAADKKDDKAADKKEPDDRPVYTVLNHPDRPAVASTIPFNVAGDPIPGVKSGDLTRIAFGLEKPGDAPADPIAADTGYLVIQLKEKTPASKEAWEKNKEFYIGAMRAAKANDALVAYVKRLESQLASDVKYTSSIVDDKASKGGGQAPDDDSGE